MDAIPDSIELLADLVAFPTISADSNLPLIDYVEAFLAGHGIAATRIPTEDGQKANLFAMVGPADRPGVILSGHTDVVPVAGQPWLDDPFRLRVTEDRAIGRGAADMKGFVACALRIMARAARRPLKRPLILALSHDEEIGCVGVRRMLPALAELEPRPELCIVGENTGMRVLIAHKGKVMGTIEITGVAGHSSEPDKGVNAILLASDMIQVARGIQERLKVAAVPDPELSVPYTTLHVGVIAGGTKVNIIPQHCSVGFEIRNRPEDDPDLILTELAEAGRTLAARHPGSAVEVNVTNRYPGLSTPADEPGVAFVQRLAGANGTGKAAYGTEAGLFRETLGIATVVCGPGDVAQCHTPEEYLLLSQIAACDGFLDRLVDSLSA
ncbi:acetylornithine deacetylase [Ancylobacter sp. Lp-2]|uniref:acetylornithine deacetylase n=1 Tax=Ancylobacter sp. Lp-2 TaxID=2881339 RepID=UPI001E4EC8BA|nr:acetylornithine deacetylase [Ancylobacter sp. Lp-2]MCB4769986.1 acetylornithine deacetylase [Ancylobacter sp. Lp-2]